MIRTGGSLKVLKAHSSGFPSKVYRGLAMEMFRSIPQKAYKHLERLQLAKPAGAKEKIYQKMVVYALRNNGVFQ
jgi:hypothetical protein